MSKIQAALFDVDGVLVHAPKLFSHLYAEKYGLDIQKFEEFFVGDFRLALIGKADLKDLIRKNKTIWQYGEPEEILNWWFEAENHPDRSLLEVIREKRTQGLLVFLATDQEQYRTKFIFEKMFPEMFDGIFSSSEIRYRKADSKYWSIVLEKLSLENSVLDSERIVYFDDSKSNIDVASEAKINAHLYEDIRQVKEVLA